MSRMDAEAAERAARSAEWKRRLVWLAAASAILGVAVLIRLTEGDRPATASPPQAAKATKGDAEGPLPKPAPPQHDVMAIVNGEDISRRALTSACIERFGEDVLEAMIGKRLVANHCANRNITVTNEEIAAEIDRTAKAFQLGREQYLELLQRERGISPQDYARDIVWMKIAMRKIAGQQIEVSDQEFKEACEREYGPSVQTRLIVVSDAEKAKQLHADLSANPNEFARAAIEHSEDVNSASIGGLIQPIRRHMGDKGIEDEAFRLKPGELSKIIPVGEQFVILKCEQVFEARNVSIDRERIIERIKDEKLREEANQVFVAVQKSATILNVYNDPQLRQTMPDVVATVNGDRITIQELGAECLARHGEEVLEAEISQKLLEQSLESAKVTITQADLDAEMRHAAELAGVLDQQGNADLNAWLASVEQEQGVSQQQYIRDSVWPSAALKKLTAQDVQVTEEDINKGFEANYGERVRCRAIVLGNMRRAQEVWEKARKNPSPDYFGDLAAEYSVEPTSKALRGEVPPLGRHGGQPQLEKVAFELQPGQLSGVIQVADKFIILRCEGRTEPENMTIDVVRDLLHRDIFEKKLRMAMGQKFEEINAHARVDNYLAGTSRSPAKADANRAAVRQDTAVRPTAGTAR
jgi:parvulin-like peptidyl-prolyl isomerase